MQKYSLTVLINEKVSEADRNGIFDSLKKNFSTLIKEDLWGVRSLAYEIKHQPKAFYAYFEFEAEPKAVITLDKNIRLNEDIIRHLIIRIEPKRTRTKFVKKEKVVIEDKKEEVSEVSEEAVKEEVGQVKKK
jgi:small subunit ribosomal protein S6